jgi:hypothetical protein
MITAGTATAMGAAIPGPFPPLAARPGPHPHDAVHREEPQDEGELHVHPRLPDVPAARAEERDAADDGDGRGGVDRDDRAFGHGPNLGACFGVFRGDGQHEGDCKEAAGAEDDADDVKDGG